MDLWFSVPTLYFLLVVTQLASADASTGVSQGPTSEHDILRLLLMASQSNRGSPNRFMSQTWGIPYRPVRRIGSEFLGKRSDPSFYYDDDDDEGEIEKRARMGSEFLGKRRMGSEFLGKRGMGSEFLGKRRMGSEFLGKRGMGSEFLGKRGMGSEFLGKRGMGSEFLGKRRMGSEFLGKRRMGSEFLGKRRMGSEFLGKREFDSPVESDLQESPSPYNLHSLVNSQQPLLLDEEKTHHPEDSRLYTSLMEKRALGSEFLGKRKQGTAYDYSWKRGRLGSEFLGKRSVVPEQPFPFLQTERDLDAPLSTNSANNTEEKANEE